MNRNDIFHFDNYNIQLLAFDDDDIEGRLELIAPHHKSGESFSITNLELITQELLLPIIGDRETVDEPVYICNVKPDFEKLVDHCITTLENRELVVRYFEPYFNLHRQLGRWSK